MIHAVIYPLIMLLCCCLTTVNATTIMIDPAGHAKQAGRKLWQSYERSETYKCAEALKTTIEQNNSTIHVILTRAPADEIVPFQNASFANRLNVDFFVRIQFYKHDSEKPRIHIYHLVFDPILDFAKHTINPHTFIPINQAHFQNINTSMVLGKNLSNLLSDPTYQTLFDCQEIYGLPIQPLVGIQAPAILIEIGLHSDTQWQQCLAPLTQALTRPL